MYNHKTITVYVLFLHWVKNKTILQAYFFTLSIQINLYIFSLFLNVIFRQNIPTNHQQNMQHPKHKVLDNYWSWVDFFFPPLCCFSSLRDVVAHIVIGWQHRFWLHSQLPFYSYRHELLYNYMSFVIFFFSTLTCSDFGQYKHSIFVENKHFMYTCQTTWVTFTPLRTTTNEWIHDYRQQLI